MGLPELNIGLVGHIDHGKTTLVEKLSGVWTDRHSEELKRGITIKLGYADCTFYKCKKCDEPKCYCSNKKCPECSSETEELRTISFVDAPGHETLMATMLSGASIMDGALLTIAANEPCPQPQTREHLMALQIIGVENIVIAQTKIDVVSKEEAVENYKQIKEFVKGTVAEDAKIIPVSALHNTNIDVLIKTIQEEIPSADKQKDKEPIMYIARSFDINKPGTEIEKLNGGVLGGALAQGKLEVGKKVKILPKENDKEIETKIVGLTHGGKSVKKVTRGGTFGIQTELDPSLSKADNLSGKVLGYPNKMPNVFEKLDLKVDLLDRVVGTKEELEVKPLQRNESLMLNIGTATTVGVVNSGSGGRYKLSLKIPVCAKKKSRVTIARRFGTRWRLIGYGIIQ